MKATKEYYLKVRGLILRLGYKNEVEKLDIHFKLVFLKNINGKIIGIL